MPALREKGRPSDRSRTRKDDVIQIRTTAAMKAILTQAAALRGQKLSEFLIERAMKDAEEAILDQRVFFLSPEEHEEFLAMLDAPAKPTEEQRKLMKRKPLWARGT